MIAETTETHEIEALRRHIISLRQYISNQTQDINVLLDLIRTRTQATADLEKQIADDQLQRFSYGYDVKGPQKFEVMLAAAIAVCPGNIDALAMRKVLQAAFVAGHEYDKTYALEPALA